MKSGKIAGRCAQSLFEVSKEAGSLDKTAKDLAKIGELLSGLQENKECLSAIGAKKEDLQSLLEVLGSTSGVFQKLYDDFLGIADARFESASDLPDDMKKEVEKKLKGKYGEKVRTQFVTNNNLVAGFRLLIGEQVVDCSAASQLKNMKKAMLAGE